MGRAIEHEKDIEKLKKDVKQLKTAFEGLASTVDTLKEAPDIVCIPMGNAGNITAYWKGFEEYFIGDRTYLKKISPRLYTKISDLLDI